MDCNLKFNGVGYCCHKYVVGINGLAGVQVRIVGYYGFVDLGLEFISPTKLISSGDRFFFCVGIEHLKIFSFDF